MESGNKPDSVTLEFFHYPNYWESESVEITSYNDLAIRLNEVFYQWYSTLDYPVILFIHKTNGDWFGIGLGGGDFTVILYVQAEEEYWYSVGDENIQGTVVFLTPEWTEIAASRVISSAQAQIALREWVEEGRRTDALKWTNDLL